MLGKYRPNLILESKFMTTTQIAIIAAAVLGAIFFMADCVKRIEQIDAEHGGAVQVSGYVYGSKLSEASK